MFRWLFNKLQGSGAGVPEVSAPVIDRSDLADIVRIIREVDVADALPDVAPECDPSV